jgi:nucleoside transporter
VRRSGVIGHRYWIGVVFFLLAAAPGSWYPVLTNVLEVQGWTDIRSLAFLMPPLAGMISPLIFASKADRSFPAEKVLAFVMIFGAVFLYMAFWFLEQGNSRTMFLVLLGLNAVISAPAWSLLVSVTLNATEDPTRDFGGFRVWGAIGWIAAGLLVSGLGFDQSAKTGQLAAGIRVFAGLACLMLPHTPPKGEKAAGWRSALGLDAFKILKDRNMATYFWTCFLFSIPLAAFYMFTPRHLEDLGMEQVAAGMTLSQASEVLSLIGLGAVMARWGIKSILLFAIGCGVVRYSLFAVGESMGSLSLVLGAVILHGLCWTFYFEAGRVFVDRAVQPGMRAQTQALLTLMAGGLSTVLGTLVADGLHRWLVLAEGGPGWSAFWWILAAMCAASWLIFAVGYRRTGAVEASAPPVPGSGS